MERTIDKIYYRKRLSLVSLEFITIYKVIYIKNDVDSCVPNWIMLYNCNTSKNNSQLK